MKKKLIGTSVLVLVFALLLALAPACGNGDEGEVKTLKIGVLMPLTGPAALWGNSVLDGTKWFAEVINEQGGFKVGKDTYMIDVIPADTQYTLGVGIRECERLIYDENVDVIFGPLATHIVPPTMALCNENKVWQYQDTIAVDPDPLYPFTIACSFSFAPWYDTWYDLFVKYHPEVKRVAITNMNVEDHPGGSGPMEQASAERHGLTVVANEYYDPATTDFYPLLTRVIAKNPDYISVGITAPGHTLLIIKTARELGYTGVIGGANNVDLKLAEGMVTIEDLEGVVSCDYDFDSPLIPEIARRNYEDFMRRVETEMPFSNTHLYPWTDGLMFITAMKEAGSTDPDAILEVMDDPDFTFETFWEEEAQLLGRETWGIARLSPHWMAYCEIHDGKYDLKGLSPMNVP